jgi:hypothetical protein
LRAVAGAAVAGVSPPPVAGVLFATEPRCVFVLEDGAPRFAADSPARDFDDVLAPASPGGRSSGGVRVADGFGTATSGLDSLPGGPLALSSPPPQATSRHPATSGRTMIRTGLIGYAPAAPKRTSTQ